MFSKITYEEQELIKEFICNYAGPGGYETSLNAPLDEILNFWSYEKQELFNAFGENLILSKEVEYKESTTALAKKIDNNPKILDFLHYVRNSFLKEGYTPDWDIRDLAIISTKNLVDNIYPEAGFELKNGKKITHNMKMTKMLKLLCEDMGIPQKEYEDFRLEHSRMLNQKKLKGTLCLSIHPLDFITMSENNCGWTSCMRWDGNGDYRQGTVEMMNSPYVVVAYLTSSEKLYMDSGSWNSKKWRQLFIVTHDLICGIRQYPYVNPSLSETAASWLREIVSACPNYGPYEEKMKGFANWTDDIKLSADFMYNDLGNKNSGYFSINFPKPYVLNFSGPAQCMSCGCRVNEGDEFIPDDLVCSECGHSFICPECNSRHDLDDACYLDNNDSPFCPDCYSYKFDECSSCNKTYKVDELLTIQAKVSDYYYTDINLCYSCFKKYELFITKEEGFLSEYVIELDKLPPKILKELGFTPEQIEQRKVFIQRQHKTWNTWDKLPF